MLTILGQLLLGDDLRMYKQQESVLGLLMVGGMSLAFVAVVAFAALWGWPHYRVWQQGLEGQAELKRAEQNRKISVQEAEAKKESAKLLAEAEVERAKGVAQANAIIGESLDGRESYLHYLWIMGLQDDHHEVIYVPTEANLPILEAGKQYTEEQ
jgi:hypothetical protein